MAGIAIRKSGFKSAGTITLDIVNQMLANGFKAIFPVDSGGLFVPPLPAEMEKWNCTLEAQATVDPLNPASGAKQPWRISFSVYDNATLGVVVGADSALPATGKLPLFQKQYTATSSQNLKTVTTQIAGVLGPVGALYSPLKAAVANPPASNPSFFADEASVRPYYKNPLEGMINRSTRMWIGLTISQETTGTTAPAETQPAYPGADKDVSASFPMSYYLAISPRGIFLSIWEGASTDVNSDYYSWLLVQRPVQRDTGAVVTTGKAPLFCVNSVGGKINRFVVRENDVVQATDPISAVVDTADATAIINDKKQVGVAEDNQYIVNYPSRLTTPRYAYTYELDMIGYAAANVISGTTQVPQKLYGEQTDRQYIGLQANIKGGNGMRIVALLSGGGIDTTDI